MKYIALILFFTSCGKPIIDHMDLVYLYAYEAKKFNNVIDNNLFSDGKVNFVVKSELPKGVVGLCTKWTNGKWNIKINGDYWNTISDKSKELLMFHELGHCFHDFEHRNGNDNNNMPLSIMHPYTFSGEYYYDNRFRYLNELHSG